MAKAHRKKPTFGPVFRMRILRDAAGLNQSDVAEYVGRTQPTVARWERGEIELNVSELLKLAELFRCAPGHLFKNGDGLTEEERDLVEFLRANPIHRKILLSQLDVLKETMPPVAAE